MNAGTSGDPAALHARPWVALGVFDGVHRGHQAMLELACTRARAGNHPVCAATFDPHPRAVLAGQAPPLLTSLAQRVELLHEHGAHRVAVVPFTRELSEQSPLAFVQAWIVDHLGAAGVVVGANFRFGRKAQGTVETLRELGGELGFAVEEAPLVQVDGAPVSSTRVRDCLAQGHVEHAAALLARPFALDGEVVTGARRGRELGMPTANLEVDPQRALPADGVYAGIASVEGLPDHVAAISVGTNPQFTPGEGAPRTVEAHFLDFDGDLYGHHLDLTFDARLRGQQTFDSVDELVERMQADLVLARSCVHLD